MQSINFNTGVKTYALNGDEKNVICFNPTDFGIIDRIQKAQKEITKLEERYNKTKKTAKTATSLLAEYDKRIREQINFVFDSDVCTAAFGNSNCMTLCDGQPIYQNFLNAIIPIIEKDINEESKKAQERIRKYTSQVKGKK